MNPLLTLPDLLVWLRIFIHLHTTHSNILCGSACYSHSSQGYGNCKLQASINLVKNSLLTCISTLFYQTAPISTTPMSPLLLSRRLIGDIISFSWASMPFTEFFGSFLVWKLAVEHLKRWRKSLMPSSHPARLFARLSW